jgi:hypothetical protein
MQCQAMLVIQVEQYHTTERSTFMRSSLLIVGAIKRLGYFQSLFRSSNLQVHIHGHVTLVPNILLRVYSKTRALSTQALIRSMFSLQGDG